MNILVIGAGNGGLAFGSKLIEKGCNVNLYDKFENIIAPIKKNNNVITLVTEDNTKKHFHFNLVTTNLKNALISVDYIFVVAPAFAHKSIAVALSKYITKNQTVVLHPGRTGGALEFKRIFSKNGNENIIAETETLLFSCRKNNSTEVKLYGVKTSIGIAAIPSDKSLEVSCELNKLLPHFHSSYTVLNTSLSNMGAIFHPVPFLLNLTRIENKEKFKYYHEGITPSIANLLELLDEERLRIAEGYNFKLISAKDWLNKTYKINGKDLYNAIQLNTAYKEIFAPTDINSRYVMEDIPMSLIPMKELANKVDIETPTIDFVIELASKLYNYNFMEHGRRIDNLHFV